MKTKEELVATCMELRKDAEEYLSDKLKDTDEDNPMEVYIPLEFGAMGLSTLEMPTITHMYKDSETIYIKYYDGDEFLELDNLYLEDLIQIVNEI